MYRIGVMPGDGVGPETTEQAMRVLAAVQEMEGFGVEAIHYPHSGAHYKETGEFISAATLDEIRGLDALYFGAMGDPTLPEGVMERGLLFALFEKLDVTVGVRPATLYHESLTPLKGYGAGDIDITLVRDVSEDAFVAPGGLVRPGTQQEVAIGLLVYTRPTVERVIRYSFELAQSRRKRLGLVTQANVVQAHSIWTRTAKEVGEEFPDVELREFYADAAAMALVTEPDELDVMVTTFWLGGILTDVLGAVVGGIGVLGDARLNLEQKLGMFQSAHGSAPKHTGRNVVSPIASISALVLMLRHLGEEGAAVRVEGAVARAFANGSIPHANTRGSIGTREATDLVIAQMQDEGEERAA
jgi:3-isopropylmalate dehydrogenase